MFSQTIFLLLSYFIGAIPYGVLIAKHFYHIDISQHGSKNTGATNVWRVLGPKPGITTFILDFSKGYLPVSLAFHFFFGEPTMPVLAGIAAIVGHNWSVFLRGKGGKGVATSAGVFIALMPLHTLFAITAFAIVFLITRRISVGSMASAITLVISTLVTNTPASHRWISVLASLMIFIKHIPNMKRLARGEEPKVNLR